MTQFLEFAFGSMAHFLGLTLWLCIIVYGIGEIIESIARVRRK